jgi:uncharacterized OB-fold protein
MASHVIVERNFPVDPAAIEPLRTDENRAYWDALQNGAFVGQQCDSCHAIQVPGGTNCQTCGGKALSWRPLSGNGRIFSWVRFHRPYLPEFADLLPYCVATIELAEGPRLYARLSHPGEPAIDDAVELEIERWPSGRCFPTFRQSPRPPIGETSNKFSPEIRQRAVRMVGEDVSPRTGFSI